MTHRRIHEHKEYKKKKMTLLIGILVPALIIIIIDQYVGSFGNGLIYRRIDDIPGKKAALLLGTVKYMQDGRENFFFTARLNAAAKLFHEGKVKAILVSGDNCRNGYDEPTDLRNGLLARGIPPEYITLDYAGFRTLDSIIRAKEIFDLDDYIIVSQGFHNERALYIAKKKGHTAIAFAAKDASGIFQLKVRIREVCARVRAFADISFLNTKPRFLGKKETVRYKDTDVTRRQETGVRSQGPGEVFSHQYSVFSDQ